MLARRSPRLLLRLVGLLLLRFADRRLVALLFQLPPRLPRLEPDVPSSPMSTNHRFTTDRVSARVVP